MSGRTSKAIRLIASGVIIVFLVIFARTINWTDAWQSMRHASLPLLAAAVGVNLLSIVFKGVRWWIFLRPAGSASLPLAMRATVAGAGLNNVLVANGGDAARVVFVSRATGIRSSTVLATLALERLFDPVGFVILVVYGMIAFPLPNNLEKWRRVAELTLIVIAVLIGWFLHSSRRAPLSSIGAEQVTASGVWDRLKSYLKGFAASARELSSGPRFLGALVLSLLSWICQVLTFEYAAAAAHAPMSHSASIATLIAVNLGLLFRATPGNVGVFQFAFALAADPFGISRNDAIAVSLLIQSLQILPVTLIGMALAPEFIFTRSRTRKVRNHSSGTPEIPADSG
ncbi:MAG: lysylphosphatidylglycerol synthase transmembrane domain-containing protein [Gemmatimonadaceae bacterium]